MQMSLTQSVEGLKSKQTDAPKDKGILPPDLFGLKL